MYRYFRTRQNPNNKREYLRMLSLFFVPYLLFLIFIQNLRFTAMAKSFSILWIFYKKLIIPTILFSLLLVFLFSLNIQTFGLSIFLIFPLLHYFIYELRLKNEYYFYANFGFSRLFLWGTTLSLSLLIKVITQFL